MKIAAALGVVAVLLSGCLAAVKEPIATAEHVDLERFMGRWYVIGNIPTVFERDAYNAVEHYELGDDGRVHTTFTYRDGGFDAPVETMTPTGYVREDTGNAVWGMQFVWPFKAEYLVLYVDADYQTTIIGRSKRDYAWIMARQPTIAEAQYRRLVERLRAAGYDVSGIRRVPQQWPTGTVDDSSAASQAVAGGGQA